MKQLFVNNAKSTLAVGISNTDLSITVASGTGAKFPNPVVGEEYFLVTLEISGNVEVVRCIARNNDLLTIDQRGLEGTIATSFTVGSAVECRTTAGTLSSFSKYTENLYDLTSVDDLLAPADMESTTYICHSNDDAGNPILAVRATDTYWRFSTHTSLFVSGLSTAGTNTTTTLTSTNIGGLLGTPAGGEYLVQFLTGSLAGLVRAVTVAGSNTISWVTPLPSAPVAGTTQFEIYKSDVSILSDLQTSTSSTLAKHSIVPLTATVATNALTITLGNCMLDFRSPTLNNGTPTTITIANSPSLVIPSTATLGMLDGVPARLNVIALNNSGVVELAVINASSGNPLNEALLISTTAISTGADSATVIYSTTARTDLPFRILGYIDITEATAGVWATAPTVVIGMSSLSTTNTDALYTPIAYSQFGTTISSNTTLAESNSGKTFLVSGGLSYLPAPKAGLRYRFIGASPGTGRIGVQVGTYLQTPDGVSVVSGNLTISTGATVEFISDGSLWMVSSMEGSTIVYPAANTTAPIRADQSKNDILPVAGTVSGNALTATLNPCIIDFRNPAASNGSVSSRIVTTAKSVVIPSGATLGTASGVKSSIVILALDVPSIGVEIAVFNTAGLILDESSFISTTAISASSDSANVAYSTTARTNVPFRIVGFIESTQATAGTWATTPSKVQGGYALAASTILSTIDSVAASRQPLSANLTALSAYTVGVNNGQIPTVGSSATLISPGAICYFAQSTPPAGWLKANGAVISRVTYAGLFAQIGTTYGAGDGSTTFSLPDMRGVFPRGWDDGRGIDPARAFGSYQDDTERNHYHGTGVFTSTSNDDYFPIRRAWTSATLYNTRAVWGESSLSHGSTYGSTDGDVATATTDALSVAGGETRPKNVALLACIKY